MNENKKVKIVNAITGTRFIGTLLLPLITSLFGSLGTAIYIGTLWLTDAIDGFLARKWEVSTIFGANFDAFCDKTFGIATLTYLSGFYPYMIVPLMSELLIVGTNWYYGKKGANVKTSVIGKIKTGILDGSTVLAILSTISLTNSLATIVPFLIATTSTFQLVTLTNYVDKNRKYLKKHKTKKDLSKLTFVETIKEIIKLLKDPKLYSPAYYKEHVNEPLLDKLYINESQYNSENKKEDRIELENKEILTINDISELKISYDLNNKELAKIEKYMIEHKISKEKIIEYLDLYIATINNSYRNEHKIEKFLEIQEKTKSLKKQS